MNKKPNFFIVGAPKCGTTSMSAWLSCHPNIFMSEIKEPHFFNSDMNHRGFSDLHLYERLFSRAEASHLAVGEASVWYMYSQVAINNILEYSVDAKFIVMLRNPVDMAYSLHEQMVFSHYEDVTTFEQAWELQGERLRGEKIGRWCVEPKFLLYGAACSLGEQLQRLYSSVATDQVLVIFLDDVKKDAQNEYSKVLKFLNVTENVSVQFDVHNSAKERRSTLVSNAVLWLTSIRKHIYFDFRIDFLNKIERFNRKERRRTSMKLETKSMLKRYFEKDICLIEQLTGRDLSAWRDAEK